MHLDVILPTYNRASLLSRALTSLLDARVPPGLSVTVLVVDNNSTDATHSVVEQLTTAFQGRLRYLLETRPGKSAALNTGIRTTCGELIGLIDDDEEIEAGWFTRIHEAFQNPTLDFIGGPYLPLWSQPPPAWLPRQFPAVIGWVEHGPGIRRFGDPEFSAMLMGGNAVVRRSLFDRVGLYSTALGPGNAGSGEDQEMYERFIAAGAHGLYLPDLIIFHYVPPERLTRSYYRRWAFRNAISLDVIDRIRPDSAPRLLGVPRWFVRRGLEGLAAWVFLGLRTAFRSTESFTGELRFIRLLGFIYGLHVARCGD